MSEAVVGQVSGLWFVRISRPGAREQLFRCASEDQARKLAAVFSAPARPEAPRRGTPPDPLRAVGGR